MRRRFPTPKHPPVDRPRGRKIFLIDIDGTICEDIRNEEGLRRMRGARPFPDAIRQINRWFRQGHYICFFTARTHAHRRITHQWLKTHRVDHHAVLFNKPRKVGPYVEYHYIDNARVRATTYLGRFGRLVKKSVPIEVFEP